MKTLLLLFVALGVSPLSDALTGKAIAAAAPNEAARVLAAASDAREELEGQADGRQMPPHKLLETHPWNGDLTSQYGLPAGARMRAQAGQNGAAIIVVEFTRPGLCTALRTLMQNRQQAWQRDLRSNQPAMAPREGSDAITGLRCTEGGGRLALEALPNPDALTRDNLPRP